MTPSKRAALSDEAWLKQLVVPALVWAVALFAACIGALLDDTPPPTSAATQPPPAHTTPASEEKLGS